MKSDAAPPLEEYEVRPGRRAPRSAPAAAASAPTASKDAFEKTFDKYAAGDTGRQAPRASEDPVLKAMVKKVEQHVAGNIGNRGSCVVHPRSKWISRWDMLTLTALVYTALVTPFEVAFITTNPFGLDVTNWVIDSTNVSPHYKPYAQRVHATPPGS